MSDNDVGYCKPPVETRFKKGMSGNPKGRPKGRKGTATLLEEILTEKITVREGDRQKQISKGEAILRSLIAKALQGDLRAVTAVFKLVEEYNRSRDGKQEPPSGVLVVPAVASMEAWERMAAEHQQRFAGNTGN